MPPCLFPFSFSGWVSQLFSFPQLPPQLPSTQFPPESSAFGPTPAAPYFSLLSDSCPSLTLTLPTFNVGSLRLFVLAPAIRAGFMQSDMLMPCCWSRDLILNRACVTGVWHFGLVWFPLLHVFCMLNFVLQRAHRRFNRCLLKMPFKNV